MRRFRTNLDLHASHSGSNDLHLSSASPNLAQRKPLQIHELRFNTEVAANYKGIAGNGRDSRLAYVRVMVGRDPSATIHLSAHGRGYEATVPVGRGRQVRRRCPVSMEPGYSQLPVTQQPGY